MMSGVLKTCFFILVFCLFMHACTARLSAVSVSLHPSKDAGHEKDGFSPKKVEDLCNKDGDTPATNSEIGDSISSLHEALLHPRPKSQGSGWPHDVVANVNVREMDLDPSFFTEEDFTETDYQPPRRKSPIHNK